MDPALAQNRGLYYDGFRSASRYPADDTFAGIEVHDGVVIQAQLIDVFSLELDYSGGLRLDPDGFPRKSDEPPADSIAIGQDQLIRISPRSRGSAKNDQDK
jgi:hypothetical protein